MAVQLSTETLEKAFRHLADKLDVMTAEAVRPVVCGGAALIALGLRQRTTHDADIVALMNGAGELVSPAPLPFFRLDAAAQVANDIGVREHWLNNGPSRDNGGLFQLGLPAGLAGRLSERVYGPRLTVYFIGRLDQIHFKLYAATDRPDSIHREDLLALNPTDSELETAAHWAMTHDVSEGFRWMLQEFLKTLGHESVAKNI